MTTSTPSSKRSLSLLLLAVGGWAAFTGTFIGLLSVQGQIASVERRAEQAAVQAEQMYQQSNQLHREQAGTISLLRVEVQVLKQRLKRYEPD